MNTNNNSFDLILEEVLNQKRVLEELQAENEVLRQQLNALRAGQGIFIDILGHRIPLASEMHEEAPDVVSIAVKEDTAPFLNSTPPPAGEQPAREAAAEDPLSSIPESDKFLVEEVSESGTPIPVTSSSFLEEALLDEFSSATTRQMGVWGGPITNHPTLDEHEKATLRRELSGSYLLE